jgi:ATP-dependent RNA helicase DeaD
MDITLFMHKYKVLKRIVDYEPDIYGIIFCRTRKDTQEIAAKLMNDGYNADALHGDLSQPQRDAVMQKFRSRNLQLLVATDVAARGLDVEDLTHIINFTLPDDPEVYTHRSGRTGRAGKTGISISFVHLKEKYLLHQIERRIKKPFTAIPIPTGSEICGKQLFHWVDKLEKITTDHREIEKLLPEIKTKLESLNREELLKRVVALEFDRFLDDYRYDQNIISPVEEKDHSNRKSNKDRFGERYEGNYARLFINLGKKDGFYPEQLIELVNKYTSGEKIPLGKIDLMKTFSFFEVESAYTGKLISALKDVRFMNRKVVVEIALEKDRNNNENGEYKIDSRFRQNPHRKDLRKEFFKNKKKKITQF